MMQLNCLPLRDKSVTDRILNQDILYRTSRGGGTLFPAMAHLPAGTDEQPVEDIKKATDNEKAQRSHPDTSLFSGGQEVF